MNLLKRLVVGVGAAAIMIMMNIGTDTVAVEAKAKPTLYIMGDSIAHTYEDSNPQHGYGQELYRFFNGASKVKTKKVRKVPKGALVHQYILPDLKIENWGRCSATTRTFRNTRLFNAIKKKLKKGDYVSIQFGHNDCKKVGCSLVDYEKNLRYFVHNIKSKGATPILITSPKENRGYVGLWNTKGEGYRQVMQKIANQMNLPFIDLWSRSKNYFDLLGVNTVNSFYMSDMRHFTVRGARQLAKIISVEIMSNGRLSGLRSHITLNTNPLYAEIRKANRLCSDTAYQAVGRNALLRANNVSKKVLFSASAKKKKVDTQKKDLQKYMNELKKISINKSMKKESLENEEDIL